MSLHKRLTMLLAAVITLVVGAYIGTLVWAKEEWGGARPGEQVVGTVAFAQQRGDEPYCTRTLQTPHGTWLVGIVKGDAASLDIPASAVRIDTLAPGAQPGSDDTVSIISRLGGDGVFHVVATVPDIACLDATPDGASLFLLTGLDRPDAQPANNADADPALTQSMIFRSDDDGASWQWLKAGLFPQAQPYGSWATTPYFHSAQEVWMWAQPNTKPPTPEFPPEGSPAPSKPHYDTGLFYSPDQGRTVQQISSDTPLQVADHEVLAQLPKGAGSLYQTDNDITQFISQTGPDRAVAWVSQNIGYALNGGHPTRAQYRITTRAVLQRQDHAWRVASVTRQPDMTIEHIDQTSDGKTYAVLGLDGGEQLARLDPATLDWTDRHDIALGFPWPLNSFDFVRYFWTTDHHQIVTMDLEHQIPRWLYPWSSDPAEISATAQYETGDGGRTWRKLAIKGYQGVAGVDRSGDRVFWSKGGGYDSADLAVRAYSLNER